MESQSLQDLHFDDVAPAYLLLRADLQGFQEREDLGGHLLGEQYSCSCHILAFTCKWGLHAGMLREFLGPVDGTLQLSTCQPELYPMHDEVGIAPVRAVGFRQSLFCFLEGRASCVHLSSCQVDTHQDGVT